MKAKINMIGIFTDDIEPMKKFYHEVLGFEISNDLGVYVEFKNEGVRLAICLKTVMYNMDDDYKVKAKGQRFELAFECESVEDVDATYQQLIAKGAVQVHPPENMPWGQRTAMFADPDGNYHEIFVNLD